MPAYRVIWEIDIDADSPLEAAKQARKYQLDPESTSTIFDITDRAGKQTQIDLMTAEDNKETDDEG